MLWMSLLLALVSLWGCPNRVAPPTPSPPPSRGVVYLATASAETRVQVELARTDQEIATGLMFRKELAADAGMLFLFDAEKAQSFWMKNTLIPLDMIFISSRHVVVGVVENAEPRTETSRRVGRPSQYVLEVNAGFARAHGIGPGTRVRFVFDK